MPCAAVAFGDVVSSDVVGYMGNNLSAGNKAAGTSFVPVSGATIDLTDLVVTGYDKEEGSEEDVKVQTLDRYGRGGVTYAWMDVTDGDDVYYGWFDDGEPVEAGTLTLAAGDGLWVNSPNADFALQSSGKVPTSAVAVTLRAGNKLVENATPVSVDLTRIVVSGYDEEEGSEEDVKVQTLDRYGRGGVTYAWMDLVDGDDVYYGWYDDGEEVLEGTLVLQPGEGLWANAPSSDYQIEFPGVTL